MKTVIFVGGTSYSGSTFFDMILANDPRGFSCGEIHALFHPYRPHHDDPECGCGNTDCDIWRHAHAAGEEHVYEYLFERFAYLEFLVDSSKNPFWIERQTQRLRHRGMAVRNILIWKTPEEMFHSCRKRGIALDWSRKWINYHRLYWSLIPDFRAYAYSDLAKNPESVEAVCKYLGIEYFAGKESYWEKEHHTVFGNTSAKIHTRTHSDRQYERDLAELSAKTREDAANISGRGRTIYYQAEAVDRRSILPPSSRKQRMVDRIIEGLKARAVTTGRGPDSAEAQTIPLGWGWRSLYRVKEHVRGRHHKHRGTREEANGTKRTRLLVVWPRYRKNNELFFNQITRDSRLRTRVIWIRDFADGERPLAEFSARVDCEIIGARSVRVNGYTLWKFARLLRTLCGCIRGCDCVLTSTQCPIHSKVAFVIGKLLRRKVFIMVQQWRDHARPSAFGKGYAWAGFQMLRNCDCVFVHGECQRRFVLTKGVEPDRIVRLPFLSDDLRQKSITDQSVSEQYGLRGKRVILYFGRITEQKGLGDLIQALGVIRQRIPDAVLLVCGSGQDVRRGESASEYERKCRLLAGTIANDGIAFTGSVSPERKQDYFAVADVFVHPHGALLDYCEGWGLVINEAASMGLPIIATDRVAAAYDLVRDGVNGYLVESGNIEALADRTCMVLKDPETLKRFGDNSRKLFEDYHRPWLIVERLLEAAKI